MTGPSTRLRQSLGLAQPIAVDVQRAKPLDFDGYTRERIEYRGLEDDVIPAFLFLPKQGKPMGGVVVFHQHNGEFHFGKSEVAGEVGDPFQAFGPALARRGAGTGITLLETVPGLALELDTHDLLAAIAPRPTLVVSGSEDKYSRDADEVVAKAGGVHITELRVARGHALERERFEAMVEWVVGRTLDAM
jgi:hypothetical protein